MSDKVEVALFSAASYDQEFFEESLSTLQLDVAFTITYYEQPLNQKTVRLAHGYQVICAFVNDELDTKVIEELHEHGTKVIAIRSAGYDHVDLETASRLGMPVLRVPAYSPHAVAEHATALLLALNRKTHRAYNRVREGNFSLEGLLGFDMYGKTVGVYGTGKIGACFAQIMKGFGCKVLANDIYVNEQLVQAGVEYVSLDRLFAESDVISLHCPLLPSTHHVINEERLEQMKKGVLIINTSRGGLVNTAAVIKALKSGKLGGIALDVYEHEKGLFFHDRSRDVIQDDMIMRLLSFPNVIVTAHQAFFTREALSTIASVTLKNIADAIKGRPCPNAVQPDANSK